MEKYRCMPGSSRLPAFLNTPLARWLALLIWMGLIFFLSSQSKLPSPDDAWLDFLFKKSAHFTAFGVLAALFWRVLPTSSWLSLWAWLLTVAYACSDEYHQSFVANRHPSARDVLIDACGAATALLLIWYTHRRARASAQIRPTPARAEKRLPYDA
jgi:VanZ family protein